MLPSFRSEVYVRSQLPRGYRSRQCPPSENPQQSDRDESTEIPEREWVFQAVESLIDVRQGPDQGRGPTRYSWW